MTNEEAIKELKILREDYWDEYEDTMPALDMAIKALEREQCEDAVSRQAVIRIAEQGQVQGYEWQFKELIKLSPVTPQPKTGHWIDLPFSFECSECGIIRAKETSGKYNFCPNCGAEMVESQESEK